MKCNHCGKNLIKIDRRIEMSEPDNDITEGQFADYVTAMDSDIINDWNYGIVLYKCNNCKRFIETMSDSLVDYNELIIAWHNKSREGDFFSRYVFEYLSFIAYI